MNSGRPETMENLPALYTIFQGEVAMVTDYGAFIKIPGCRKQGLVHRTHMSSCRVDKPSEIVDVGDKVWVKLIGREARREAEALLPGLHWAEDHPRGCPEHHLQEVWLQSLCFFSTGHFAKDCFMQPGGTKYSLIPEEEEEKEEAKEEGIEKPDPTKNSSRKRKKEKKKKKHRDRKSSDCDSSDSESDMGKKARHASKDSKATKKKKKKKKHKKHKE
ncbi:zinc finger CCHC domain-containing protein 17 isoform X3 [Peromyscus californicus insignis]|uniref:zinc finger CCHC domain-containing protein 17 isoform X3 n=1 Tax=Peromyscus californicus insignis TaxID=564181 RepID=UPI0022A671F9|nr:zinc finger CCHC domain-containing protein 17 isoform X3 [Peromyscus californicus insignis]